MKLKNNFNYSNSFDDLILVVGVIIKNQTKTKTKELFIMNEELREEGYYMVYFEFKLMGIAVCLDKGQFV